MEGVLQFAEDVGRAIWGVWTLDTSMAEWFASLSYSVWISVTIAILAGISTLLGNSVVLFLNRVRGWRFATSLLLNGVSMAGLYLVQAVVIAIVGYFFTGQSLTLSIAGQAVMLATAPLIFGFFELVPYLGPGIARVLQAWSVVALWTIVGVLYGVGRWEALVITVVGWGTMQLLAWALARPISAIGARIWRLVTGHDTMLTAQDLLSGHQFTPVEIDFQLPEPREGRP